MGVTMWRMVVLCRTGGGGAFAFAFVFAGLILSFVRLHLLFLSMHRFNGGENRISQ